VCAADCHAVIKVIAKGVEHGDHLESCQLLALQEGCFLVQVVTTLGAYTTLGICI
jgi:hypothetical protein